MAAGHSPQRQNEEDMEIVSKVNDILRKGTLFIGPF